MKLSKMFIKHCPEVAELYITPRNLGFYECNGVKAVALGARVVQDTGQAGALIIGGATVGITPQGLYYMEGHDPPRLYNRNEGGRAFDILPDGQKVVVLFKKEGDRRPYYNLTLYYYSTGEIEAVDLRDITFANYNYALALYSLLRSLRKYGHPMAAYATKIIAF